MSEPTLPDNRTKALPHEHADVSANVPPAALVLEEIRSTRLAWMLCEAGKLPIDYAADVKNLWNLFDKRIGAPPDIGDVKDQQKARMALRLMEAALTPTAADSDSGGGMKPDSTATAELTAVEMVQKLLCQARMEAESGGGHRGERQKDELPWAGPEWDNLAPLPRRLLRHMHGRDLDEIANFTDVVWERDDVSEGSIHTAISKANNFLRKQNYPRLLSKVRGEPIIRWE